MGNRITICHWNEGGHWEAIEVSTSALNGHDNHETDIWPPVPDVTEGQNWPEGESVYLNGCVLQVTATPEPTPSPSGTLPETGANLDMFLVACALIGSGLYMKWRSWKVSRYP